MCCTRVQLSMDELIALKAMLKSEIRNIDRIVELIGDPAGVKAEDKALAQAQALYEKFGRALKRV